MDFLKLKEDGITIKDIRKYQERHTGKYVLATIAATMIFVAAAVTDIIVNYL